MSTEHSVAGPGNPAQTPPIAPASWADSIETVTSGLAEEMVVIERHRDRLMQLSALVSDVRGLAPGALGEAPLVIPLTDEEAAAAVERLLAHGGTVRSVSLTLSVGPGTDEAIIRQGRSRMRDGTIAMRQIYSTALLDEPGGRRWIRSWAEEGEVQRVHPDPPSEFVVFSDQAVIAAAEWCQPESGYVLIRGPQLIAAYTALFEATFLLSLPVRDASTTADDVDERILELLGVGMKDESIARHLNLGLRTVRRRIGRLMDARGVQTRYQLGTSVAAEGRLPPAWIGPGMDR